MGENSPLREHEKFWAFVILIIAIVLLAAGSLIFRTDLNDAAVRILDSAVAGLIGIAGMSAQALFRFSATEQKLVDTVYSQAESIPSAPREPAEVKVVNTAEDAVPTTTEDDGEAELRPEDKIG